MRRVSPCQATGTSVPAQRSAAPPKKRAQAGLARISPAICGTRRAAAGGRPNSAAADSPAAARSSAPAGCPGRPAHSNTRCTACPSRAAATSAATAGGTGCACQCSVGSVGTRLVAGGADAAGATGAMPPSTLGSAAAATRASGVQRSALSARRCHQERPLGARCGSVRLKTSHSRARVMATYRPLSSSRAAASVSRSHRLSSDFGMRDSLCRKATRLGAASSTAHSTSTTPRPGGRASGSASATTTARASRPLAPCTVSSCTAADGAAACARTAPARSARTKPYRLR